MSLGDLEQAQQTATGAARLLAMAADAEASTRARQTAAAADIFAIDGYRLSDRARGHARDLLRRLVAATEDSILARVAIALDVSALGHAHDSVSWPLLRGSRLLAHPALVAQVMRRVDSDTITDGLCRMGDGKRIWADHLIEGGDGAIASAVTALIAAEERRRDRFDAEPLALKEFPTALRHHLVWGIAASLRDYVARVATISLARADHALADAGRAVAGQEEAYTLDERAMALVLLLGDGLDDDLIAEAIGQGHFAFAMAALSARAGIAQADVSDMARDPDSGRLIVLLRAIGFPRRPCARVVIAIAMALGRDPGEVAPLIEAADDLSREDAERAIAPWRLDPAYRRALGDLGGTWL